MKTMTCKDMGGPCDAKITAGTAQEMMKKGGEHVMAMKDPAHMKVAEQMNNGTPESNKQWEEMFMKKWEAAS